MKCKVVKGNKENLKELCDLLGARSKMDLGPIIETVSGVIDDIRENGDNAVLKYTEKFDKSIPSFSPSLRRRQIISEHSTRSRRKKAS